MQLRIDDEILSRLKEALAEDIGDGDLTTTSTVTANAQAKGRVIAKKHGVFCGYAIFSEVFGLLDDTLECRSLVDEGQSVEPGTVVAEVSGNARNILYGERLALNLMGRMSGIASMTCQYVERMNAPGVTLLDTRKTMPLWRALDKYAVRAGGGKNHRIGLYDMILIKENHIALAAGIRKAIEGAKANRPDEVRIEVEVQSIEEMRLALEAGPDMILLDNFTAKQLGEAVEVCDSRAALEAFGGITLENIAEVAATGVDRISVGALTHSVVAFDLSMILEVL